MTFLANNSLDDYKSDIKPDPSMPPLGQAFSSMAWATNLQNIFAATSWDGELRVFQIANGAYGFAIVQKLAYKFPSPALKCVWNDQCTQIYVGLMDGTIKIYDLGSGQTVDMGRHNVSISSLSFVPGQNVLVSTGYENIINFWQAGNPNPVLTVNADNKVFAADFQYPMLIAGTANQRIMMVDITSTNSRTVLDSLDLGKFSQIQSIALNQKGSTYGIASFDGRANLSSIVKGVNGLYTSKSTITFKSNKQEQAGNTILYPINSVGFNPINQRWFMTAGSDGSMHFWDFQAKNKIKTLNYGGTPLCCAKVSPKGDMIAYGLGNDWHVGQEGSKWQTKLGVHPVTEAETKFQK